MRVCCWAWWYIAVWLGTLKFTLWVVWIFSFHLLCFQCCSLPWIDNTMTDMINATGYFSRWTCVEIQLENTSCIHSVLPQSWYPYFKLFWEFLWEVICLYPVKALSRADTGCEGLLLLVTWAALDRTLENARAPHGHSWKLPGLHFST